jgi:hypothetical protein
MMGKYLIKLILQSLALGLVLVGCSSVLHSNENFDRRLAQSTTITGSISERILNREFPSTFQAWNPAENLNVGAEKVEPLSQIETPIQTVARHDLILKGIGGWKLKSSTGTDGEALTFAPESVTAGLVLRKQILSRNTNAILIAEVRYDDAKDGYFPADSPWWKRDISGVRIPKTSGSFTKNVFLLDYMNPTFQEHITQQCAAVIATGVVDGCFFDWWSKEDTGRINLIQKVRAKIGDTAVIFVNVNGSLPKLTAPCVNGVFMEGFGAKFFPDWKVARENLLWFSSHLKQPNFSAFEPWFTDPILGRDNQKEMRFTTGLSLEFSDGYVLYADPDPLQTEDHLHDWYSFWDKTLGHCKKGFGLVQPDGTFKRQFEKGTVILNPPGNSIVKVHFDSIMRRASDKTDGQDFNLDAGDADIFIIQ